MWIAEFKAWHDSHLLRLTEKLDVRMTAYYLNTFREGDQVYINRLTIIEGPDTAKAIAAIPQEKRIRVAETGPDYIIYQLPEIKGFHTVVADRRYLFIKPQTVEKGVEYWTVAAAKKQDLLDLYKNLNKLGFKATIELLSIRQQTPRFFHGALLAELTEKQRRVFELSLHSGYYQYPRKADAKTLARRAGMKYTTFTEHLRKAEGKVMAALAGNDVHPKNFKKRNSTA